VQIATTARGVKKGMDDPFWPAIVAGKRLSANPDDKRTLWYYFCAEKGANVVL